MLRLFLENQEVELSENIQFAITKQFEDVTNPTSIINDWSKTVKIPSTAHNDKLFGHIFNVDRLTAAGDYRLMGIYFDPYKKIDFRLQWGDAIVMTGYAKNISIDKDSYNITLNGELGKIFQEMKKITFDQASEDNEYIIDGSKYIDETINKDLVYRLWTNEPVYSDTLEENYTKIIEANSGEITKKPNLNYKLQDYLGFAPNNSYSDSFDYKTFQLQNENKSKKFSEVLDEKAVTVLGEEKTYADATGITAETVIGDGLLPREIGEYRSYYQLPYIHFNKLFRIITKKAEDLTGYSVELDNNWFNATNPYWANMVYMLKTLDTDISGKSYNSPLNNFTLGHFTLTDAANGYYTPRLADNQPITWTSVTNTTSFLQDVKADFAAGKFDRIAFNQNISVKLAFNNVTYNGTVITKNYLTFGSGYYMYINFRLKDKDGNVVFTNTPICLYKKYGADKPNAIHIDGVPKVSPGNYETTVNIPFSMTIDRNIVGDNFDIEVAVYSYTMGNYDTVFYFKDDLSSSEIIRYYPQSITFSALNTGISVSTSDNKRSDSNITLNDLWNNEYTPFDEILNYCKQYRIGVFCDYINKKLIFKPLVKYFRNYTVENWTDKVDFSKDYHIEPITFQNKYVLFNYEECETQISKSYNEKFGVNFGEYKLTTEYDFNTDTTELFEYSKIAIPSTDFILSWGNLYDNMDIIYTLPAEITIHNKDEDKKNVDVFGSMLFYKGLHSFDITSGLRSIKISDDTNLQSQNQTYFYSQNGEADKIVNVSTYPVLDIVYGDNLNTYTTPNEIYTYEKDDYDYTNGIYTNFWKYYLDERYSTQNKLVTCYINLKPQDYINFEWNKFVKIENQLYFVNKIYDYAVDADTPTKVDLITIQDIKGYTSSNYKEFPDAFTVYRKDSTTNQYVKWNSNTDYIDFRDVDEEYTLYVTSEKSITWEDTDAELQEVYINGVNGRGSIAAGNLVPIKFTISDLRESEGYITITDNETEVEVFVRIYVDKTFKVYKSDGTLWTSSDKIDLDNDGPLTQTIYVTSPNTRVKWEVVGNDIQDLGVCVNGDTSDWGDYEFGSGYIPAGTRVPVTFRMEQAGDVQSLLGNVKLSTSQQTTNLDVRLIYWEIFKVFRWDGTLWDEQNDYIRLTNSEPSKIIYLTANSDVEWSDESGELQSLGIYTGEDPGDYYDYDYGSGVIPKPSNMKPIYFRLDPEAWETGSEGKIILFNGRHEWKISVVLAP